MEKLYIAKRNQLSQINRTIKAWESGYGNPRFQRVTAEAFFLALIIFVATIVVPLLYSALTLDAKYIFLIPLFYALIRYFTSHLPTSHQLHLDNLLKSYEPVNVLAYQELQAAVRRDSHNIAVFCVWLSAETSALNDVEIATQTCIFSFTDRDLNAPSQ